MVLSGSLPLGAIRFSGVRKSLASSAREEAVLDQAHQHAAGEVLVALHHVDIGGLTPAMS